MSQSLGDALHRLASDVPELGDIDRALHDVQLRRRRTAVLAVMAACLALLLIPAITGVSRTNVEPAVPTAPEAYVDDGALIESGTYRMLVGMDGNEVPIRADLTFGGEWVAHNYPWMTQGAPPSPNHGGVAVYQPQALAAGTGCGNDRPNPNVGETPEALAAQLAQLPDSTVVQAPTAVQAFGRDAVHVQTRIDNQCGEEAMYRVAATLRGGHGISYGDLSKDVVMDFWTMDVGGGVPVVVETWHQVGMSGEGLDQITATRDSIAFVTGG